MKRHRGTFQTERFPQIQFQLLPPSSKIKLQSPINYHSSHNVETNLTAVLDFGYFEILIIRNSCFEVVECVFILNHVRLLTAALGENIRVQ